MNCDEWKIHWRNCPSDDDTWEPRKNLIGKDIKNLADKVKMTKQEKLRKYVEPEPPSDSNQKQVEHSMSLRKRDKKPIKYESESDSDVEITSKHKNTSPHKNILSTNYSNRETENANFVVTSEEKEKVSNKAQKSMPKKSSNAYSEQRKQCIPVARSKTHKSDRIFPSKKFIRRYLEANPDFLEEIYAATKQKNSRNLPLRIFDKQTTTNKAGKRKAHDQIVEGKGKKILTAPSSTSTTSSSSLSQGQHTAFNSNCSERQSARIQITNKNPVKQQENATETTRQTHSSIQFEAIEEATTPASPLEKSDKNTKTDGEDGEGKNLKRKKRKKQLGTSNQKNLSLEVDIKHFGQSKCKIEFC